MLFRYAKRLHNGDQIQLKKTEDCGKVLSTLIDHEKKIVYIEAVFDNAGYRPLQTLTHTEII